jgi:hypothetical protein
MQCISWCQFDLQQYLMLATNVGVFSVHELPIDILDSKIIDHGNDNNIYETNKSDITHVLN